MGYSPPKDYLVAYSRFNYNDPGPKSSWNTSRGEMLTEYRPETDFHRAQVDTIFEEMVEVSGVGL